jgi:hypothetical protein
VVEVPKGVQPRRLFCFLAWIDSRAALEARRRRPLNRLKQSNFYRAEQGSQPPRRPRHTSARPLRASTRAAPPVAGSWPRGRRRRQSERIETLRGLLVLSHQRNDERSPALVERCKARPSESADPKTCYPDEIPGPGTLISFMRIPERKSPAKFAHVVGRAPKPQMESRFPRASATPNPNE